MFVGRSPVFSASVAIALIVAVMSFAVGAAGHEAGAPHPAEALAPLPSADRMVPAVGGGLFAQPDATSSQAPSAAARGFIKRWRMAALDAAYRDRMMAAAGVSAATVETFKLPLFDDAVITLYKTGMRQDTLGSTIWTGRVVDTAGGEAMLVFHAGMLGGTVRLGNRQFMIEPSGAAGAKIVEIDPDQRPHADPRPAPAPPPAARQSAPAISATSAPPAAAASTPTVITILVAYTPAAAAAVADIQSAISMGISYTNQALANSGVNAQLSLAGIMTVDYAEGGAGYSAVLSDAQNGVGNFAAVHARRNVLKADLVSVWSYFKDACGVGYQLDDADRKPTQSESEYGYDAISLAFGYACLTDGVAHEIGHNMGAAHDRYIDDPTDLLTGRYNFGYVDIIDQIRTIMSYPNACSDIGKTCTILPYHSSPNLTYQGHLLGIPDVAPNAADNVRRINEIAPYIAKFRSGGPSTTTLLSALLPGSRSIETGHAATFFMTLLNTGSAPATNCVVEDFQAVNATDTVPNETLTWQTTDPVTNRPTGTVEQPFSIPAGGSQSLIVSTTVTQPASQALALPAVCDNADPPTLILGVNSIFLTADTRPVPDVIALTATAAGNGIVSAPTGGAGAFAVATIDIGTSGTIVASADTGSVVLPVTLTLCETVPATGQCKSPPTAAVTHTYTTNDTPTFSVFAAATGPITFSPATSRIFVRFTDASGGILRGSTSVAIKSP